MSNLPARYTIERVGNPQSRKRHLAVTNDGGIGWTDRFTVAAHFQSRRSTLDFIRHRMGATGSDAMLVRHSIH